MKELSRRTVLGGIGSISAAAIGGVSILAMTGPAAAADFSNIDTVEITSNDGSVEYIAVYGDSVVKWTGFDDPAEEFAIEITAEVTQNWDDQTAIPEQTILDRAPVAISEESDWGNHDEDIVVDDEGREGEIHSGIGLDENGDHDETIDWHVLGTDPDGYGLPTDPLDASSISVSEADSPSTFTLVLRSTYTWYDSSGDEIFSETFGSEIEFEVTNEEASASATDGPEDDGALGA